MCNEVCYYFLTELNITEYFLHSPRNCWVRLKCDGTRAETRFRLSAKRTSPFKSAGTSVQSTTGSRGVRISGSNAGYIIFRGSLKSTPFASFPSTSPSVRHRVPSRFNWTLPANTLHWGVTPNSLQFPSYMFRTLLGNYQGSSKLITILHLFHFSL